MDLPTMTSKYDDVIYMTEDEIMDLELENLCELTPEEEMKDNFRRMFQIL
jgi:hypothetical protein